MIPVLLHCLHGGARHRSEIHFAHLLLLDAWYLGAEPSQPSNLFTAQQGFRLGALWNLFPDATSLLSVFFTV